MAEEEKKEKTLEEILAETEELIKRLESVNFDDLFNSEYGGDIEDPFCEPDIFDLFQEDDVDFFAISPEQEKKEKSIPINNKRIRTIKGNSIDLNKVFDIEKIEREHNNKITYGIKFIFKGKNKYYRIVWFNENKQQRDRTYEQEYNIWQEK